MRPVKIGTLKSDLYLGDKLNLGARAIIIPPPTTTTTASPPTPSRRFGSILKQNFQSSKLGSTIQNSKLGASIQSLASKNLVGDAPKAFANFQLGKPAAIADSNVGAPAPDVGAPEPEVGAPAPDVGAPPGVITQPAHTL